MTVLEAQILSNSFAVLAATLSPMRFNAAFAVDSQSVRSGTIFVEFTFFFPSLALGTTFLLHAPDLAMAILIHVVCRCHCLSVLRRRPPFLQTQLEDSRSCRLY